MKIYFRVDASIHIGSGHLMRCLTLAEELRQGGADVCFITRSHEGDLNGLIQNKGFKLYELPLDCQDNLKDSDRGEYAIWLGVTQEADAAETVAILKDTQPDWLIIDHYAIDESWERLVRPYAQKIMVIDDLANRYHDCDLLLDQNYENPERYLQKVNANCSMLLGPHFALLRPEYADRRTSSRRELVSRVLVFFGGSDPDDLTGMALEALSESRLAMIDVDVIIGSSYSFQARLEHQAKRRGKTVIYGPQPHLADLMASADLAIGAGGVTNWERMCLGLPSIVITLADNQVPVSEILHRKGALRLVGSSKDVTVKCIRDALLDEIFSHRYSDRVNLALAQCDGLGLHRVVEAMHDFRNSNKLEGDILNSN